MCSPTAAVAGASLALTAATTGAQMKAKSDAADAQEARNEQIADEAIENHSERVAQIQLQNMQDAEATGEKIKDQRIKQERASAKARLSAMETGTSGNSVDALFREFQGQQAEFEQDTLSNLGARQQGRVRKTEVSAERAKARTRQMTQPVEEPNYLAGALKIGQGALSAYDQYSGPDGDFGLDFGPSGNDPATTGATSRLKAGPSTSVIEE